MFNVPDSSSPPSTPDPNRKIFRSVLSPSFPSTTPAAPPPATSLTHESTTPAGPPPSSAFGTTQHGLSASSFLHNDLRSSPLRRLAGSLNTLDDSFDAMDEDHDMIGFRDESIENEHQDFEAQNIRAVARGLAKPPAALHEAADTVLTTEIILQNLSAFEEEHLNDDMAREEALAIAVQDLLGAWKSVRDMNVQTLGVGPGNAASALSKSVFLVSLLLSFHHPPRSGMASNSFRASQAPLHKSIPETLLDWLRDYHNIYPDDYAEVMSAERGPAAHERLWDTVYSLSLRGRLTDVVTMLKDADFGHALTALEDGAPTPGYDGKQLGNVQRVVNRAVSVLESCPAIKSGDWNVTGNEYTNFRRRISQALSDLQTFAEGSSTVQQGPEDALGLSTLSNNGFSMSKMSRRAQSQVPWSIYENLTQLYGQLLGMRSEVVSASADWVEAVIGLTVWWDGEQDDATKKNLAASRRSASHSHHTRMVDVRPGVAYQEKLALSLRQITSEYSEPELQCNATEPVEVGLACIFEGNLEGLLGIVRGWTTMIGTAVVEIARMGLWLGDGQSPSKRILNDLDQSDLMVLSYNKQEPRGLSADRAMVAYAETVSRQPEFISRRLQRKVEGWELAIRILNRVQDTDIANKEIAQVLDGLDLASGESIEKIMKLCDDLNLPELGRRMAERFAGYLAENTSNYGGALFYYARAHQPEKIKEVINVLISTCLVQSKAFPLISQLDKQLRSIVASPNETLEKLATSDRKAAEMLAKHLSGYAMLRKFYDLRDEEVDLPQGAKPSLRPIARKRQAAMVLVAVIISAADSIHGGLFDESVDSVIQVDGLLVLVGEALMFLNQDKRFLNNKQIFSLLKAAEDVSTVSGVVFQQCEECLKAAIGAADGAEVPSPQKLLRKSTSGLAASQFSLINSTTTLGSQSNSSLEESGVLVKSTEKVKRAWDWRKGLGKGTKGADLLKILRLGLARELSRSWMEGDVGDAEKLV